MKPIYCKNQNVILSNSCYSNPNSYNALHAALAFLTFTVCAMLLQRLVGPLLQKLLIITNDAILVNCISVLTMQGMIALVALIFSQVKKVGFFSGGGFVCKFDIVNILFGIMLCFGVYFVVGSAHFEFVEDWTQILYLTDYETYVNLSQVSTENANPILAILYTFVLVPLLPAICEEALYRGVIMRGLRQFGDLTAVLLTAFLFAIMHGNYQQLILQFAVGIAISSAVMLSNNLFVGMAMHFCYNLGIMGISLVPEFIGAFVPQFQYLYSALTICIGLLFIVIAFVYFANLFIHNYKRKVKNLPTICHYPVYYVLSNGDDSKGEHDAMLFCSVTPEYYEKSCNYRFYYKNGKYVKFNKVSNKVVSLVGLGVAIALAIVEIIISK